jgi:hypothetical protein
MARTFPKKQFHHSLTEEKRMSLRALFSLTWLLAVPAALVAQAQPNQQADNLVKLVLDPQPAPRPALKYQLLPELREMHAGNPVLGYLKCFCEQSNFFFRKDSVDDRARWQEMPLDQLPMGLHEYGGIALRRVDEAARLMTPNWEALAGLRRDNVEALIPEVQQVRMLLEALKVRLRGQIAVGRFDDAVNSCKTMLALSRHVAEHPCAVSSLVGLAGAHITLETFQEMVQQPGCPNMFWALTYLPHPLIDIRLGLQGNRHMYDLALDKMQPLSRDELEQHLDRLRRILAMLQRGQIADPVAILKKRATDKKLWQAARQRLLKYGLAQKDLDRMPDLQIILLDEYRTFTSIRDDAEKLALLPYWQASKAIAELNRRIEKSQDTPVLARLAYSIPKIQVSQARLEQKLGLLCCVEAIRMYAAENQGKLPANLDALKVPLPIDPFTGKAFSYRLEDGKAVVRLRSGYLSWRYEISIRK